MKRTLMLLSLSLYNRLLFAYPSDFYCEYGEEMRLVFQDACRDALDAKGISGLARFWTGILADLMVSTCKEHFTDMDKKAASLCLLAFALGLCIGYLDFHSKEVQVPVFFILVFTFGFGLALPQKAWRWALLIGAGVPLCHIVNALLRRPPPYPVEPNVFATCIAFIPAFIGAYTGAFLRRLFPSPALTCLFALMCFCFVPSAVFAQSERISAYAKQQMQTEHIPGLSIAVVHNGKTAFSQGFGLANVELRVPATSETAYLLLSVAKQFTATAVMLLIQDGKFTLETPVAQLLSDAPTAWKDITIRHLLTHTSGIPDYTNMPNWFATVRMERSPEELLKPVREQSLLFAPGERFRYSNSNYYLLGLVLEKISGKTWATFLQERIFTPLHMTATHANDLSAIVANRASGYHWQENALHNAPFVSPSQMWAAGAVVSTVTDLAIWEDALTSNKLLPPSVIEQMSTPAKLTNGTDAAYGFGNELGQDHGHRFTGHQGGGLAFNATLLRFPKDALTVIVLANLTQAPSREIARKVASFYLPDLSDQDKKPIADSNPALTQKCKTVLSDLMDGKAQEADFTPAARQEMLPKLKRIAPSYLKPLGILKSFTLVEEHLDKDMRRRIYRAAYSNATLTWTFTMDQAGEIADLEPTKQ